MVSRGAAQKRGSLRPSAQIRGFAPPPFASSLPSLSSFGATKSSEKYHQDNCSPAADQKPQTKTTEGASRQPHHRTPCLTHAHTPYILHILRIIMWHTLASYTSIQTSTLIPPVSDNSHCAYTPDTLAEEDTKHAQDTYEPAMVERTMCSRGDCNYHMPLCTYIHDGRQA